VASAADHDAPATPPREFRIFRAGWNDSEKGDILFDEEAAKLVMEAATRWGNRYPIDYSHGMVRPLENGSDPAEQNKAAGWFTPELRGDELWATNVVWTPLALQRISNREFAYFSPAFLVDEEERVVELTNIALTNLPAMRDLEPLVAAEKQSPQRVKAMDKSELKAKIHARHAKLHGAMYDAVMKAAYDKKFDEMSLDDLKAYDAKLAKHMPDGDGDAPPHEEPDGDEAKDRKHDDVKKDDEDDEAADRKHSRDGSSEAERVMLSRIRELESKFDKSEAARARDERSVILERAVPDGKITPAESRGEGSRGAFLSKLSTVLLKEYVEGAEKKVRTNREHDRQHATDGATTGGRGSRVHQVQLSKSGPPVQVTLSKEELRGAAWANPSFDEDAYARMRAVEMTSKPVAPPDDEDEE
jgi:phage I-like protein